MVGHVGLTPVPDGDVGEFLVQLHNRDAQTLLDMVNALFETLKETNAEQQPRIFAYGKLVNMLASDEVTTPELHAICAAALWQIVSV